ncbi:MAG: hypothetical protein JWN30_1126 [Bacilli bacterium]|nr:hypothetical protein [Bacilli bacterium]
MMTPQAWNTVSNLITVGIAVTTALQLWETIPPIKGRGLKILLGDVLMIGAIPWIAAVMSQRATFQEVSLSILIGLLLSIPLILTSKIIVAADGSVRFKRNVLLYLFLIAIPILRRYEGFTVFFKSHSIFFVHTHIPDIELMIVLYLTVVIVNIQTWRITSFLKFRRSTIQS